MIMPAETQEAVNWALQQENVSVDNPNSVVDTVRRYFDEHGIQCEPMSMDDLLPYLPTGE